MPDSKTPTPAEIAIMAGGAVALVGSFLPFAGIDDFSKSAWSGGYFPVATLMAIFAFVMGLQIVLTKYAGVKLPERVLGFTWPQIHLELGFFATLYAVAFLLLDNEGVERKIGFWLILVGCIAALVGAVLLQKERSGASGPTA